MKLIWAMVFWLGLAGMLAVGLVRAVEGSPGLLLAAGLAVAVAFARIGCLAH